MKKIILLKFFLAILVSFFIGFKVVPVADVQALDYECMGTSLSTYTNAVIDGAGNLPNVKLLSPAFNMTSFTFDDIVNAMADGGANFSRLDGIAGNSYNLDGKRVTEWVNEAMDNPNISGMPVVITETGMIERERNGVPLDVALRNLEEELGKIKANQGQKYISALIFNAFGGRSYAKNNGFEYNHMDDGQISQVCGGACEKIGVNSASYFSQNPQYYLDVQTNTMGFSLEIATNDVSAAIRGIQESHAKGITPVVRIGVGDDSGGFDDPQDYVDFIKQISGSVSKDVYFIAGPNEPDLEYWLFGDCDTTEDAKPPERPLDEGFTPQEYACTEEADPAEFNPMRPYPASACDPLIPQSIESAQSSNAPDYKKYITYSCGNTLAPEGREAFDPYGNNGKFDPLKVDNGVTGAGRQEYAHTVCEKNGLDVTCYRSSSYDLILDLKDANLGILGNTQDPNLTDAQKVNEYLGYYLTGVPQITDHVSSIKKKETDRLINFAGPLRKLLPWDLQNVEARGTIANEGEKQEEIHNYQIKDGGFLGIGEKRLNDFTGSKTPPKTSDYDNMDDYQKAMNNWRFGNSIFPDIPFIGDPLAFIRELFGKQKWWAKLYQNLPLSGMEDTAGEFIVTVFGPGDRQDPDIVGQQPGSNGQTAPAQLTIIGAGAASGGSGSTITPPDTYNPPPPEENPISCGTNLKIMPFGDSITKGYAGSNPAPFSPGGYRGPLRNDLLADGFTVDMVGNSPEDATLEMGTDSEHEGWGTKDTEWLKGRIGDAMDEAKPNTVLIHAGTNRLTGLGVPTNIENLKSIINTIKSKNSEAAIFVAQIIQIPAYPEQTNPIDVPEYNRRIKEEIDPIENVVVVNMYSAVDPALIPDGIHPNKAGYEIMARVWTDAISANCK